ncbi:MAG: DUF885 domain-containing protein [Alphaproteobacteria bacterium]|nr:DUF885 domain-containing protein [Alphaproteobacteria bacterium]
MWILPLLAACAHRATVAPTLPDEPIDAASRSVASAGVINPSLAASLEAHWEASLRRNPEWATSLGDHRFDDQLSDASEAAERAWLERLGRLELELVMMPDEMLPVRDRLTRDLLLDELRAEHGRRVCRFAEWNLSARSNELVALHDLVEHASLGTPEAVDRLLARYVAFGPRTDVVTARLRQGLAAGRVSNRESVERVLAMLDEALAKPVDAWKPFTAVAEAAPDRADRARTLLTEGVLPALGRYRDLLRDEILPVATTGDRIGLGAMPDGDACYAALIREHTTLTGATPADLHQTGLDELERIHTEMRELGQTVLGTSVLAEIIGRLRDDPSLRFSTADEVRTTAEEALQRAQAAVPEWIGLVPATPCGVDVVPEYLAPYTTIAWYEPMSPDRPGTYFVNTWRPETRPRFEAEVLAFHESVPGHHLQIAVSREAGDLPAFRRYGGSTAFVEGWALYVERLADEMGLYSSDLSRLGMLSFDTWRASRLVVDTGIHAMGWSREQAEAFLLENTALSPDNVRNEVDRYVTWPGQALAYKTGQLRIAALRAEAEEALGDRFDPRDFHAAVLREGAVSLPALDRQVERWIEERQDDAL